MLGMDSHALDDVDKLQVRAVVGVQNCLDTERAHQPWSRFGGGRVQAVDKAEVDQERAREAPVGDEVDGELAACARPGEELVVRGSTDVALLPDDPARVEVEGNVAAPPHVAHKDQG